MAGINHKKITEADLQIGVVDMLRRRRIDCPFWHTANEGKFPVQYRKKLADLGILPGVADLLFMPGHPHMTPLAFIELKRARGRQSDNQKRFQEECERRKVPYALIKSDDQNEMNAKVLGTLKAWGIA